MRWKIWLTHILLNFVFLGVGVGGGGVRGLFSGNLLYEFIKFEFSGGRWVWWSGPPHLRPPFRSAQSFQYSLKKPKVFDWKDFLLVCNLHICRFEIKQRHFNLKWTSTPYNKTKNKYCLSYSIIWNNRIEKGFMYKFAYFIKFL